MKQLLIFFALTFSSYAHAQDLFLNCGTRKIPCDNGNKDHFKMVMQCPYEEADTTKIPQAILDINRSYLLDRVGADFYAKLRYYSCQTIDFKNYNEAKKTRPYINKKTADKRVKYAIQYYFIVQDSMRYYLSLVYDKDGKLLSEHFLPDNKTNQRFDKIIDVCAATQIAETDSVFRGELKEIYLDYLPSENSFVWVMRKPDVEQGERTIIHRYIIINATTGQLIKRTTAKGFVVCRLPSF
jgi:hypothetical protein